MKPLPPTAQALLRALVSAGGAIPYTHPLSTTQARKPLIDRGFARVDAPGRGVEARVVLTATGEVHARAWFCTDCGTPHPADAPDEACPACMERRAERMEPSEW